MLAGAAGFATSFAVTHRGVDGKPVPSRFAGPGEFEALLDVVREVGRGVVAVAPGEQCGIDDLYELQPGTGVPFTYGALLTFPSGAHKRLIELNRARLGRTARRCGRRSRRGRSCSPVTVAEPFPFNVNPEFAELMAGSLDERRARVRRSRVARRARDVWAATPGGFSVPRLETYEVGESRAHPELVGQPLARGRGRAGCRRSSTCCSTSRSTSPTSRCGSRCILANDDTRRGRRRCSPTSTARIGLSDAGAHVGQLCDAPQATDFLGNWVRERDLMPIETAVRKLTGTQADLLGLPDRGYLRDRRVGRRRGLRPGDGRPRADPPGARLPGRRRAPHRRSPDRACATSSSTARRSRSTANASATTR